MKQEMKNLGDFPGVVENLSCCFYITQAEEPYELLYANEEMLRLFDCRDFDELYRHVDGDAFHVIAMDDRARVKQEIVHELAERNDRFDHARGHLFTRTSRIRYADVSGRIVETQAHGKVCYCTLQEIDIPLPGVTVDRDIRDYVISHLDEAIENHWIQVYYQPVIRTLTGELCGMEALARWVDPQIGFLSPASFIPVLEQVRLIHQLDAYVLEEVCHMLRQRLNHDLPITPVSFNLSRYDFDMVDVFHLVEKTRAAYQIPRDALHVEITESALAENDDAVHRAVDRLRDEGYEIWLDDFGSGYSSLNILKDYTVDLIKLDMGFLRSFTEKSRDIIRSVIDMAKELGIKTLAEGVETQEHAEFLASIGCGRQQGYYYGKPQPLVGTLAHIEAEGREIELRKWCHYYDVASMAIRETNQASSLFDLHEDGYLHYLYTNRVYREQLHALGYRCRDVEGFLNHKARPEISATFRHYVSRSLQSGSTESFCYIDGGDYIRIRLRVICEMNHHLLIHTGFENISRSDAGEQLVKLDNNLRYLYTMFENISLVDFQRDTIEPIYVHDAPTRETVHGIRRYLQSFAQEYVYEPDRQGYLDFCNPDTAVARIQKSRYSRIAHCCRVRDPHGNYHWRECVAVLLQKGLTERSGHTPLMLTAEKTIEEQVLLTESRTPEQSTLDTLLWQSLMHHTRFCYFWKDKDLRFLGATKAFLKFYGFNSEADILGKTDEEMNWHLDNDTYRLDEIALLQTGKPVENVKGTCIIRGVLRHITCYKWPLYREGEIIGLLGVFFEAEDLSSKINQSLVSPYEDPVTGLHNRQGFLGDLISYQEAYAVDQQPYALILLESCFDEQIQKTYGPSFLRALIRQEADILRTHAGKDTVISRLRHTTFAILRRETSSEDCTASEAIARDLQQRLQSIHQLDGNPVTITFRYSIVHATDPAIHKTADGNVSYIYRLASERLRHKA